MSNSSLVTLLAFVVLCTPQYGVARGADPDSLMRDSERTTSMMSGVGREAENLRRLYHGDSINRVTIYKRIDVPSEYGLAVSFRVHRWIQVAHADDSQERKVQATIRKLGTLAWKPVAIVEIKPYETRNGILYVADSLTLEVQWLSDVRPRVEQPFVVTDNSWYDPSRPYVRLRTARDGVAFFLGDEILNTNPALASTSINDVALFWKGEEQHIAIIDADNDGIVTQGDTVLFQGRRPTGDSTYYDMNDTVSVFFLTKMSDGERKRLQPAPSVVPLRTADRVIIDQRIEFDTGYYHLGSATNPAFSEFNSDLTWLEGFYWERLNANGYQKVTHKQMLTPAPSGSVTITALYAGSSDVDAYSPDTRADLTLNGTDVVFNETDGTNRYSLPITVPSERLVSGLQSLKLFSTGIDSLRQHRDYYSDVLLEAYQVKADVLPVLDSGRMHIHLGEQSEPVSIAFSNATSYGYALDTLTHEFLKLSTSSKTRVIRSGLSPRDRGWITDAVPQNSWRASATIDDETIEIDSVSAFALVELSDATQQAVVVYFDNADALANKIHQVFPDAPCVVINAGGLVTQQLRSVMTSRNMQVPSDPYWTVNSVMGKPSASGSSSTVKAFGATLRTDVSNSPRNNLVASLPASDKRVLFIADTRGLEHARVERSFLHDLGSANEQTDAIIVTHRTHWKQSERLAAHRRAFNGISVRVVDVDEIIDEFGTGHSSAEAVRLYLAAAYERAPDPKPGYVILFGATSWDVRLAVKNGNVSARMSSLIPTYGRPSSDYFFSLLDDPKDYAVPEVIVGRLPATSVTDGEVIVDKILHQDTSSYEPWRRRWMFVGGGSEEEGLCNIYEEMLGDFSGSGVTFVDPPFSMDTVTLCKHEAPPNAGYFIKLEINQGLQWLNYIGHGAPDQFDITGWDPNELSNAGRYGVLATYACQTGSFSNPPKPCKNAQYLTEPRKGFVAAMGGTGWEFQSTISYLHYRIHELIRDTSLSPMYRKIGDVMYEAKSVFAFENQDGINTVMQYCLLGDPTMRIHLDTVVDVLIRRQDVAVTTLNGQPEITDDDTTATLTIQLQNRGLGTETPFLVSVRHTFQSTTETLQETVNGIGIGTRISIPLYVLDMAGDHTLEIAADPEVVLDELNRSNNSITTTFTVLPRSLLPLEPIAHGFIANNAFHVRVIDPTTEAGVAQFVISSKRSRAAEDVLLRSTAEEVKRDLSIIDWTASTATALPIGSAWLAAWMVLDASDQESAILWLPVNIVQDKNTSVVDIPGSRMTTPTPESVMYDSTRGVQTLSDFRRDIYIRSSGLNTPDIFAEPVLEFRVGDVVYVKNPFFRGINLMILNENDSVPHTIRRYDTYKDPLGMETGNNGSTHELLQFLRDSVSMSDRVCFASCNEALTGFIDDNNLDSLVEVLHGYGSKFADSLDTNSSWAMIGRRGLQPGEAPELWKGKPDSLVTLITPAPFYARTGTVNSGWFGPARAWDSVVIVNADTGVHASLSGRMRDGTTVFLADLSDTSHVWYPDSAMDKLAFVAVTWTLDHIASDTNAATVTSAHATFTPAHEWIIEPNAVQFEATDVLRGDSVGISIDVRNADRLSHAPLSVVRVQLPGTSPGSVAYQFDVPISELNADALSTLQLTVPTDIINSSSEVSVQFDPQKTRTQFYVFNDRRTQILTVREDDEAPRIMALADSVDVTNGGYVLREPLFEILVRDNSQLPINDSSRLIVFVNGDRIKSSNTSEYQWIPSPRCSEFYSDPAIRAALQFKYPLELGQNNLIVRCSDATGNTAELETQLWTTDYTEIASVVPSPTPSTGPITFTIELRSDLPTAEATITISDINGRSVGQVDGMLSLGKTSLPWDGLGADGQTLSTGVYAYSLRVTDASGVGVSDVRGTLMILR